MSNFDSISAVILAAGKGTRMKSSKAKVLHELFFAPMIHHVLAGVLPLDLGQVVVVTGHQGEAVEKSLADHPVLFARQQEQRGTGDAVLATGQILNDNTETVLILCGDTPLIRPSTLKTMLLKHQNSGAALTVMSTMLEDSTNYGRIITNDHGHVEKIIEQKDASPEQLAIKEVNAGIYCVSKDLLFKTLNQVGTDNKAGEMYLTDIVGIAATDNIQVNKYICPEADEIIGVNSKVELAKAAKVLQNRRNHALMTEGVSMMDPQSTFIDKQAKIGQDTTIGANVIISGPTVIGEGCTIEPMCTIDCCQISNGQSVESFSKLSGVELK